MSNCLQHDFDTIITPWKGSLRLAQGNALGIYEEGNNALKGQKRYAWLEHFINNVFLTIYVLMLLPFQGVLFLCIPTQGVATLYPGLSADCPFRASLLRALRLITHRIHRTHVILFQFFGLLANLEYLCIQIFEWWKRKKCGFLLTGETVFEEI